MDNDLSYIQTIIQNQDARRGLTTESHLWFFTIYFPHYITYEFSPYHRDLFTLTENEKTQNLAVVAFRGFGKSTIMNMSYPIWSILGRPQKKFVLIVAQTQQQARQHIKNLKNELEENKLLQADLGPFEEPDDEWRTFSLVIPKYDARITAISIDQSMRGIRHNNCRPDLIICDDIEDLASVKTMESRDKTFEWVTTELIPAGDKGTQFVIIGNLLHEDSVIMRFKKKILDEEIDGEFREYAILDKNGLPTWPGKYPDLDAIEKERRRIGNDTAWQREYLLRIVTDRDCVVDKEWIRYYDEMPPQNKSSEFRGAFIGIDLAISQKAHADYTAMVSCYVFGYGKDCKIYILPNPINERLTHMKTLEMAKTLSDTIDIDRKAKLYVEEVGYQGSITEQLKHACYPAEGVKVHGQDKRARLVVVSHLIQEGTVLFPKRGAEKLVQQLTGFGTERHDDLADAFSILMSKMIECTKEKVVLEAIFIPYDEPDFMRFDGFGNIMNMHF